jgi:hypothetical protein
LSRGTRRSANHRLQGERCTSKCMIMLCNRSCAWVRVKEGANAENHEEDRESMRLKVDQRNRAISRRVEWFQDRRFKITTWNWVGSTTTVNKGTSNDSNERLTTKPRCNNTGRLDHLPAHGTGCTFRSPLSCARNRGSQTERREQAPGFRGVM